MNRKIVFAVYRDDFCLAQTAHSFVTTTHKSLAFTRDNPTDAELLALLVKCQEYWPTYTFCIIPVARYM